MAAKIASRRPSSPRRVAGILPFFASNMRRLRCLLCVERMGGTPTTPPALRQGVAGAGWRESLLVPMTFLRVLGSFCYFPAFSFLQESTPSSSTFAPFISSPASLAPSSPLDRGRRKIFRVSHVTKAPCLSSPRRSSSGDSFRSAPMPDLVSLTTHCLGASRSTRGGQGGRDDWLSGAVSSCHTCRHCIAGAT